MAKIIRMRRLSLLRVFSGETDESPGQTRFRVSGEIGSSALLDLRKIKIYNRLQKMPERDVCVRRQTEGESEPEKALRAGITAVRC